MMSFINVSTEHILLLLELNIQFALFVSYFFTELVDDTEEFGVDYLELRKLKKLSFCVSKCS